MNFFKTLPLILALLAIPVMAQKNLCPPGSNQKILTLTAGVEDAFKEPTDPTFRREELDRLYKGWIDFDEAKSPGPLGHTFVFNDLPCMIVGATLTFSAMPFGRSGYDDTVSIGFDGERWQYTQSLQELSNGAWEPGRPVTITIDLAKEGLLDLISKGYLDILFLDSTSVDFMKLDIIYCEFTDCNNNCIPDETDIATGTSQDSNRNGIPDECEELQLPSILCPPTIVVIAGTDCCGNATLIPTAVDVEGDYVITNNIDPTQTGSLIWCFPLGSTTVTFTLNDYRHTPVTCTTTVIVIDKRGPVIMPVQQ